MIKRLLPLSIAALLYLTPQSTYAKDYAYALAGSSNKKSNPLNLCVGVGTSTDVLDKFLFGIDLNIVLENKNYETGASFTIDRILGYYTLGVAQGVSLIRLSETTNSPNGSEENFLDGAVFIRPTLSKKLNDKLSLKAIYQRNHASEQVYRLGYPQHRFSLGIERLF